MLHYIKYLSKQLEWSYSAPQVSVAVYEQLCNHIADSVRYVIVPNTIVYASQRIDEARSK